MKDRLISLLKDIEENGEQTSWDWMSDYRYAKIIGDEESETIILKALNSHSTVYAKLNAVLLTGIPSKRMRDLRELVKLGYLKSCWVGSGEGGYSELGVRRLRAYYHKGNV